MIETREPLQNKTQTANSIKNLVNRYYTDLDDVFVSGGVSKIQSLSELPLDQYYNFVRKIPYRRDKKPIEVISRPYHILKYRDLGMDCKKKAILMAAYFKKHKIPYRFIGSSNRADKRVHHIFPQIKRGRKWVNTDATYPDYHLYQPKTMTYAEVL